MKYVPSYGALHELDTIPGSEIYEANLRSLSSLDEGIFSSNFFLIPNWSNYGLWDGYDPKIAWSSVDCPWAKFLGDVFNSLNSPQHPLVQPDQSKTVLDFNTQLVVV